MGSILETKTFFMRSSLFWDVTQRRLVVSYRRFGATCRPHLQGSSSPMECLTFYAPIFTKFINAEQHYTQRSYTEFHPNHTKNMKKYGQKFTLADFHETLTQYLCTFLVANFIQSRQRIGTISTYVLYIKYDFHGAHFQERHN